MSDVQVIHADARFAVDLLGDASIDSVVTDPPYALVSITKRFGAPDAAPAKGDVYARAAAGFMGKQWDTGEVAFDPAFWVEVLRVLKPGGHVVAFGGTRTYHRLACAIEDAGFEIRDQVGWVYGTGFPKSHDVSKGIDVLAGVEREVLSEGKPVKRMIPGADQNRTGSWVKDNGRVYVPTKTAPASELARQFEGWGTALKPAWEPIVLARKPLIGTVAENIAAHGTGAINIDGCRIEAEANHPWRQPAGLGVALSGSVDGSLRNEIEDRSRLGRWPANIIHDGSDEVIAAFPDARGQIADASSSSSSSRKTQNVYGAMKRGNGRDGEASADRTYADQGNTNFAMKPGARRGDSGSAARFFYSAKASRADRAGSKHPTIKPIALMRYLCRLVTPKGGTVLDPFAGSGTTGQAAREEGFRAVLIEREAEYVADIKRRLGMDAPADDPESIFA